MREVEAFLAVAEELHFGRAASRLRVTTSDASQRSACWNGGSAASCSSARAARYA
jgi:Bacterial regulatory helix-turn-helix protein, lysR family